LFLAFIFRVAPFSAGSPRYTGQIKISAVREKAAAAGCSPKYLRSSLPLIKLSKKGGRKWSGNRAKFSILGEREQTPGAGETRLIFNLDWRERRRRQKCGHGRETIAIGHFFVLVSL
jgi:hypothetical protein